MANENQQASQGTSLDALASLMKLFVGGGGSKTVEQGGTQTQTTANTLAPDVIAQFLKQALESNQGLVSTLQGQKSAGLYNSSTNRLLANDLLARMSAQAATNASQVGGKTVTTSSTPGTRVTTNQGALGSNGDLLGKLMLGLTAYQKLGGKEALKGASSMLGIGSNVPATDMISANMSQDPITALAQSQGWFGSVPEVSAAPAISPAPLDVAGLGGDQYQTFAPEDWQVFDSTQATADAVPTEDWAAFDAATEEYMKNFSGASVNNTGTAGATSSEILSQSEQSANTSSVGNTASGAGSINLNTTGSSAMALYSGISALTDSNNKNDIAGIANTAAGAKGAYNAYQSYQSAAQAAETANQINAAEGVSSAYTATDYMNFTSGFEAGSGSTLGYVGPIMDAFFAQNNPEGAQNKDYRHAVGGAILNYFGAGWASPIVHAVAEPLLNATTDAGEESLGVSGAVLADPIGSLISGEYEFGDVVTSGLDPANVLGGNKGGSTGALVGAVVDPVGAMLGDTGVFSGVKDAVNTVETSDPVGNVVGDLLGQGDDGGGLPGPGKVICTELAMNDKLDIDLYKKAISPELVMKGQMLLGYHIIGVQLVEMMRKNEKLSDFLAPYVADYIRHKAGKKNLKGFLVKSFLHPISWVLGFFNRNPDYYKVLYPHRRNRKAAA